MSSRQDIRNRFFEGVLSKAKMNVSKQRKKKDVTKGFVANIKLVGTPTKWKSKGKSNKVVLTLDEALVKGNKLITKTKENEVEVIYEALEHGLADAFPYKKTQIPGIIHSNRLHIASTKLKYKMISQDQLVQVCVKC